MDTDVSDYRFSFEHYRVPTAVAPSIPTKLPYAGCKQGTQWGIDYYAMHYSGDCRAEFLIPVKQRKEDGPAYRPGCEPCIRGGKTICYISVLTDQRDENGWRIERVITTATAWCSINDVFNYSVGRAIARGRAWKKLNRLGEVQ